MMDFLLYEGKVAIVLLVFYLFYRFLLKKETFHRFNPAIWMLRADLQELLFQIFMDVREEKAQSVYGKRMKDLTSEELSEINRLVPISISETDMKKIKR